MISLLTSNGTEALDPAWNSSELSGLLQRCSFLRVESGAKADQVKWFLEDLRERFHPQAGGLCVRYSNEWLVGARKLNWDSSHFGFAIADIDLLGSAQNVQPTTVTAGSCFLEDIMAESSKHDIKHFVTLVDSGDTLAQLVFQRAGFVLMDTTVTYELGREGVASAANSVDAIRPATEADLDTIANISSICFGDRQHNVNRFNSDSNFPPDKVRSLYDCWVRNSFHTALADEVLVYESEGKPIGFITLQLPTRKELDRGSNVGNIPLNAVAPPHQGQGIYGKMIQGALRYFENHGVERVQIGTHLTNTAVHRTWSKLGASITASYHRFHFWRE